MDFPQKNTAPEEEANPGEMTQFAADIFARQPFRGYELRTALASTDRTAVFKARDHTMERAVAIKVLHPCREREGVVEDFFSLAGSIARLRCQGVARGLDVGRGEGDFFLVYEFVRGENLANRVARLQAGRLSEKESLKVVMETAGVLQNLFENGHPHGHITPSNIIQGEGGKVKLTDVGFAWNMAWRDDAAAFRTNPHYLPPERIEGEFNIDIRGDLYSLGAIWFQLLMGRPIFQGETPEETLEMHLRLKPWQLHKLDEKITESTSNLVRWLLEKDRDARPRTPKEFLRKLASHPLLAGDAAGAGGEATPEREEGEQGGVAAGASLFAAGDDDADGLALSVTREVDALIRGGMPEKAETVEPETAAAEVVEATGEEADEASGVEETVSASVDAGDDEAAALPADDDRRQESVSGESEDGEDDEAGGDEAVAFSVRNSGGFRLLSGDEDADESGDAASLADLTDMPVPELSEAELFEPGQVLSLPRPPDSDPVGEV